ncbi:MAG: rhodanese-like domain-containing protein [Bacteroidota bacterium]
MCIEGTHALDLSPQRRSRAWRFGQYSLVLLNRRLLWWNLWCGLIAVTTFDIILSGFVLLAVAMYFRRKLQLRSVTTYSPREVAERMKQSGSPVLLDVRTSMKRERNSIKGSLHIPLHELGKSTKELEKYKNREIICYCQSGNRSISAAARLTKLGFTAASMNGGISEWNSSGLK